MTKGHIHVIDIMEHAINKYGNLLSDEDKQNVLINNENPRDSYLIYNKLIRNFPIEKIGYLHGCDYKTHKALSKKPGYFKEMFNLNKDDLGILEERTFQNKIYEIVFSDIKNVPHNFNYAEYFSYYDGETYEKEKNFDFLIFFKEYLIKNNITVSIEDISKNERLQQYALELEDEDDLDEAEDFSEIEIEHIRKLFKYNKIEKELKEKWNKVHESFESKRSSKESTQLAFRQIDEKLRNAKEDLIITIDHKEAFDNMVLKTLFKYYLNHIIFTLSDVDMQWLIFFMIQLVDLQKRNKFSHFNALNLNKLNQLSSNTLFELGPYLHKLLPTKQQFSDEYEAKLFKLIEDCKEGDDSKEVLKDCTEKAIKELGKKSFNKYPKLKRMYDTYIQSRGVMKKGLKTTSISKDIQSEIMRHYL